jgi:hypothetical protein
VTEELMHENGAMRSARSVMHALSILGTLIIAAGTARAVEVNVLAREVVVRRAPFDIAPEVARVHAGDKLAGNDQASGEWRFVKLPDGRGGYVREADIKVVAPSPAAPASAPAAPTAAPVQQAAQVTALELGVRGTPAADAPVVKMLRQNDQVVAFPELNEGWRSIRLPDGQMGFVREAGLRVASVDSPPAEVATTTAVGAAPESAGPVPPPAGSNPSAQLGVVYELLPTGNISTSEAATTVSADTTVTNAVAPFIDFLLGSPNFSLGFSPQFIFGVKGSGAASSATEYDLRARLTARYPVSSGGAMYTRLSPGYSIVSVPDLPSGVSNPAGFAVDITVGGEIPVVPQVSVVVELGYQLGFQGTTDTNGADVDYHTRFLHLGAGFLLPH